MGNVELKGGTVVADNSMTIDGNLTANAGALTTANGNTATVTGNATFSGAETLTNSGTLVVKGDAVFADKSVKESKGTVTFGKTATMNAATLKAMLSGTAVNSADNANAVITLNDSGSVNLSELEDGLGLINSSTGAIDTKLSAGATNSTLTLHIGEAAFAHNTVSGTAANHAKVTLSFDTLNLGDGSADVTAKAANLKVSKALTVSGDHALVLSDASKLTLKAADQELKTIGGKGVTLGVAGSTGPGSIYRYCIRWYFSCRWW